MTGQLIMFELEILTDTTDVISSLGSADGTTPCRCAGTKDLFGQAHVPVSPSARPARARVPMTDVICGLRGFLSSASADLQSSLESRLRRRLDGAGSTLFSLIWRRKATPAGRPYYQLAVLGRRTSDNDCGSWPTDHKARGYGMQLNDTARLASWATPNASAPGGTPEQALKRKEGLCCGQSVTTLDHQMQLASWPTPKESNTTGPGIRGEGGDNLQTVAGWATSRANKWGEPDSHGKTVLGSPAPTEKRGQLNPAHSRWL